MLLGDAQQLASRRDPLGSTRHCIASEAKPSAVPPPPARRFGGASSADAANPRDRFYTTGFGNASADPLVDRGMASLEGRAPVEMATLGAHRPKSRHWFFGVAQVGINSAVKSN